MILILKSIKIKLINYKQTFIRPQLIGVLQQVLRQISTSCFIETVKMKVKKQANVKEQQQSVSEIKPVHAAQICINIKIIIQDQDSKNKKPVEEFVDNMVVNDCLQDPLLGQKSSIVLKKLLLSLKNQMNFALENKQIYFYLDKCKIFMNCGIDPINEDIKIRPSDYKNKKFITIKAKDLGISMVHRLMTFQNTIGNGEQKQKGGVDEMAQKSKCRRTKERRIGHIIDKVIEWRKFYSGGINEKNQSQKFSLEDAAKKVEISKKSLDDYLFQIRFGLKFKFNFNEHYNDKVGVLRDFVRQKKKNDKYDNKTRKNNGRNDDRDD